VKPGYDDACSSVHLQQVVLLAREAWPDLSSAVRWIPDGPTGGWADPALLAVNQMVA
jgi:hypothetical protein